MELLNNLAFYYIFMLMTLFTGVVSEPQHRYLFGWLNVALLSLVMMSNILNLASGFALHRLRKRYIKRRITQQRKVEQLMILSQIQHENEL